MTACITRDLSESSEFVALLRQAGWQVQGRSLLALSALPLGVIPAADWIFFSSQNAVRFWPAGADMPAALLGAIGPATAAALQTAFGRVNFTGVGDPETTARQFKPFAAGKTVLFPGARHSRQSVQQRLGDAVQGIHLPVYDNRPVENPARFEGEVLVFTSPMNVEAYCSKHPLLAQQRLVAIGQTTAAALSERGFSNIRIAPEPTERSLAETVLRWSN